VLLALCLVSGTVRLARADDALHEQIDRLIEADQLVPLALPATDAEFLRRASLDLMGRIPSTAEARAFADDPTPDKRTRLIDRLLASPDYARHMATVFDVSLMERRPEKNVPIADWQRYLYESIAANKPYDQLVREILSADGVDAAQRAPARFYLDREGEANLLARDVGRIFLGMDLQCAQCHDHPIISDYYQADYQGLYAFFNRSVLFTDKEKKVFFAEKADGDVNYQSVFDASRKGTALPQIPGGQPMVEPTFNKGEEYTVAPADGVRPIPKYSRRAQLATELTSGRHRSFDRAIVNRLWAHLMGRGLVDPVDLHHSDNPPSHPAVLALLADAFPAMKYDVKALLTEMARTRIYARSIDLPSDLPSRGAQLEPQLAMWEDERARLDTIADASQKAAAKIGAELSAARTAAAPVQEEHAKAQIAAAEAKKNADAAVATFTSAQNALPGKEDAARLLFEAAAKTAEAAQKLADDKELVEAATKLKARTDQLTVEVATLTKAVADGPAAVKATTEQLSGAQQALAAIAPRLEPLQAQVTALLTQAKAADVQARDDRIAQSAIVGRIEDAKTVVGFSKALALVDVSRTAAVTTEAARVEARQSLANFQIEMDRNNQTFATAQQASSAAAAAVEAARKQQADKQSTLDAVKEALSKTELAQQKLPSAGDLAQAVQSLKTKVDELDAEMKTTQAAVAEQETVSKSAIVKTSAAQQAVNTATEQHSKLAEHATLAEQAVAAAQQKVDADLAAVDELRKRVIDRTSVRCAVAVLKHLTPEQLARSIMQASGVVDRERAGVEAEWQKNHPTPDKAAQAARTREIDQALNDKLQPSVRVFVSLFAAGPGQPQQSFQATVDQALFLANGGQVRSWLAPADGNLTDRLVKLTDPSETAIELYLTVLSRLPTAMESAEVTNYLANRAADRPAALQELEWALFSAAEFRFNH
jgi:hypothetical protein